MSLVTADRDDTMELLERRANVVRTRLLETISALEVRKSRAFRAAPFAGLALVGLAIAGAAAYAGLRSRVGRRPLLLRLRDRFIHESKLEAFARRLLEKIAIAAALELVRRTTRLALGERTPA